MIYTNGHPFPEGTELRFVADHPDVERLLGTVHLSLHDLRGDEYPLADDATVHDLRTTQRGQYHADENIENGCYMMYQGNNYVQVPTIAYLRQDGGYWWLPLELVVEAYPGPVVFMGEIEVESGD